MTVLELHAEHGIGQQFHNLPPHFEKFFLGQAFSLSTAKSRVALQAPRQKWKAADLDGQDRGARRLATLKRPMGGGRVFQSEALADLNADLAR